ncbi:tetratricopeptide repeat protein [Undibacterium sp. TC4M20W]|uniref:tetratricopeptide repeat protein n=1 Tax=unclassified Undibacterium TaxID=2630295 RepID=UPI003BF1B7F5
MAEIPHSELDALFEKASRGDNLAFTALQKEAERGDASAERFMGIMYLTGKGVKQDQGEARKWLLGAAEKGLASAQSNLANMYARGAGVPRNQSEALRWWTKSAVQGYAIAQYNLGQVYMNGNGVPVDMVAAVSWYRKAAEQREPNSQFNLGIAYANGDGVPRDLVQAHMWWRIASVTAGSAGPGEQIFVQAWNNMTDIAKDMTTAQIAAANKQANEWISVNLKSP